MAYLTENNVLRRISIPVSLALTQVRSGDWLTLCTTKLTAGMTLSYQFLQLQLVDIAITFNPPGTPAATDPCAAAIVQTINQNLGAAYVAIFQNFDTNTNPKDLTYVGTGVDVVAISETGIQSRDTTKDPLILTEAADYSFVLVNNATNADLRLAVHGQVNLTI